MRYGSECICSPALNMHSGLSYSSILKNVAKHLMKPAEQISLVVCHLGSGASMCCIKDGKSIDTTMGLTPLEGALMPVSLV